MSRRSRDDDDGVFDDDDDEEEEEQVKRPKKKKKMDRSFFDDAAEESGEEGGDDDDDEDDDDEDNNDYVKDDFVVDEDDDDDAAKKKDVLDDSDDDDSDDDDDDDEDGRPRKKGKLKKVRKMRNQLLDDDLDLVREARGETVVDREAERLEAEERARKEEIRARNADELRRGLFHDSGDEAEPAGAEPKNKPPRRPKGDLYDEEGLDDFIEDDIGDQGDIMASEHRGYDDEGGNHVSEAQLHEASEIFGTDYLEFMGGGQDEDEEELMGKHEGINYGYESEEDDMSEDDDADLFGDDETGDSSQKAEAIRLKREKKRLAKAERRRDAQKKRAEKRKAQLRRVFEPVQLVENFCTDRDDEIRQTDIPERFFDERAHLANPNPIDTDAPMTEDETAHAKWAMGRISDIKSEYTAADEDGKKTILESIAFAFRFMREPQYLEPAFIKRYRKDYVTSPAVREHLYTLFDEDKEFKRISGARTKVCELIQTITDAAELDKSKGADSNRITELKNQLEAAKSQLEDSEADIAGVKAELEAISKEDEDDDELFGDDNEKEEEKKKERARLKKHLETLEDLVSARREKANRVEEELKLAEMQNQALNDPGPIQRVLRKTQREALWDSKDYENYLRELDEGRHVLDVNGYVKLIKEGNEAIRKKELPILEVKDSKNEQQKRSRRFDRDYYRTCVAEGLRAVCYKFLLPPNRVGIKLEAQINTGTFDFTKIMPGEEGTAEAGNPLKWAAPTVMESPNDFANGLIGSGDLVLLSSQNESESSDPFRGCRYVAALELASEPRVRKCLRTIYRKHALLTSKPTKKGLEEIDAFHEYYGLHLIRNKPVPEHFPIDEDERASLQASMYMSGKEFDEEMKKRQTESCLLFLNMMKAERTGHVSIHIHLPLKDDNGDEWYKVDTAGIMAKSNQEMKALLEPLEKVYFPVDGDSEEWNQERSQVLRLAISNFLVPQFEKELRRDLQEAASKLGVKAAAENLRTAAMEGPYRPASLLFTESRFIYPTGDVKMVGVCCSSDNKDATYLAAVSEKGEAVDFLAIPAGTSIHAGKMRNKVTTFLLQFRPAAVVIGTSGGYDARMYSRRLTDIVNDAMQRWINRDVQGDDEDDEAFDARRAALHKFSSNPGLYDYDDEEEWKCNVELIDDNVSQLYGRSVRSKKEFPDFPVTHKCAISVARYAKDPLAEYTYTWSVASDAGVFGTEMLYLNVHPMQQLLPRTYLLREYERVLCDAVASVGTDINAACQSDHLRGLLLFVPGLGPRKAANIKQILSQQGGLIARRRDLLENRYMGPIVYNNAVAFLRIRQTDQQLVESHFLNPLDDTRIHPDLYIKHKWAVKIAFDALDREHQESRANRALNDVMKNSGDEVVRLFTETKSQWEKEFGQADTFDYKGWDPRTSIPSEHWSDKIDDLNLVAFADKIQTLGQGRWHSHFEMLTWEFRLPFVDPRVPMERLTGDKLFNLITNETDQSLRPGKEVTGKVMNNGDFGSRVKLEGNIEAFIPLRNLSDDHVEAAEEVVHVGQTVHAVVAEVKKSHMSVDLSLKAEDLRKPPHSWPRPASLPPLDSFFDRRAEAKIEEENSRKREERINAYLLVMRPRDGDDAEGESRKPKGRVVRRACTHPAFRNGKHDEVDKELREGGPLMVGEALLRPSSKNSDALAVHWVVREGSIKVIEVSEDDKENDASIGKKLKIKDQEYGSIDELLARYIGPMNDFVEELVNHRKFCDLTEDQLDEKLMAEKKANPASIPYGICWMEMHPGYGSLRFVQNKTPRHHPIGISPRGFTWSSKSYPVLDKLLNDFKRNPRGSAVKPPAPAAAAPAPPPAVADASRNRWGSRPAPPPAPMPPPPAAPAAWQPQPPSRQPPPPPPVPVGGYRAPPPPPPQRPPPPNLPPPPSYRGPPPPPPPPPPNYGAPPPPARPPPPPPQPPAFGGGGPAPPVGRGRGRTLPAWMSKQS